MGLGRGARTPSALALGLILSGCAADGSGPSETGIGAAIGTAAGAALGALVGAQDASAGPGALIGALGGAWVGGMVGAYMEQQRRDFEKVLAPQIAAGAIRVDKAAGDELLVGMTGETTFEVGSDQIKSGLAGTLDSIAQIVTRYGRTRLRIEGHTDSTGSERHNQDLSERRAAAVQRDLAARGLSPGRMEAAGFGATRPLADNDTEEGRRLNRRVDIRLIPIAQGA